MLLSILIPTYNRATYLEKNLMILYNHITKMKVFDKIEIIISNNCSSDNTHEIVENFKNKYPQFNVFHITQESNIGLEKNALEVLKYAQNEYVMYLGDDDYVDFFYLEGILSHLTISNNTHCIIPSNVPIDINGNLLPGQRDINIKSKLYKQGFKNCLQNSWRGHQLSGLVLKRKRLYQIYKERDVGNIYLFIFLVGYCCLKGDTYHFTNYPIKVTSPGQENKDWNYGNDGLIDEIFDNYLKLPVNYLKRSILQLHFFKKQSWRLWGYREINLKEFFKAFFNIWFATNGTFIFKIFFPFEFVGIYLINKVKRSF